MHVKVLAYWSAAIFAALPVVGDDDEVLKTEPVIPLSQQLTGEVVPRVLTEEEEEGLDPRMPRNVRIENLGPRASSFGDTDTKVYTYLGDPVHMKTDNGIEVFAKKAVWEQEKGTITLTGDLAIFQDGQLSRADKAIYNNETKKLQTIDVKARVDGFILRSGEFDYEAREDGPDVLVGRNASITTEDAEEPLTWISGKEIRLYAEDSIALSHMKMYYGGVPIFYFPYFYHSLNPREGYMPNIGSRSNWGGFLLNKYGVLFGNRRVENRRPTADYLATLHLDYRSRRNFGLGVDLEDIALRKEKPNMKGLSVYGVDDKDPTISPTNEVRQEMDEQRWRIALQQMWNLQIQDTMASDWRLKTNINAMSDEYMLRDFFQETYQKDAEPDNTVALTRTDPLTSFTLLQRIPMNDFYLSDQRTELNFDRIRAPLSRSSITYESQSSASLMRQYVPPAMRSDIRRKLDDMPANDSSRDFWERMLITDGYFRLHTYHELSTTYKAGGFLNLTPRIGGGYTGYYDVSDMGSFDQGVFFASLDSNVKFSRKYANLRSDTFGLNGLTHIVQPYVTFSYIGANEAGPMLPRIDGYSASTTPVALSPGRMTEIDSMSTAAVLRYGVKNFLMTDRDGASTRWFTWDMFMDAYFHDAADDRKFSNLYTTMSWNPLPWLSYNNTIQYPLLGDDKELRYREYNNYFRFQATRSLEMTVGHRYLSQHPILEDDSQLDVRALYRINEELSFGGVWRWDLKRGDLEIQEYNVYKNLGSWYFGTGLYFRKNGTKDEVGFGISLTMKETGNHMPVRFY